MSYAAIHDKLKRGEIVLLDGGIGLMDMPELNRAIHRDYIHAGAEVISTNSFQLCKRALFNHFRDDAHRKHIGAKDLDDRADRLLAASVQLAREAREQAAAKHPVLVAGAVTTLEWCFRPDLAPSADQAQQEYRMIFQVVKDAGADLVLLETVNSIGEASVATEVARSLDLPIWVAFVPDETGRLFTGETLDEAAAAVEAAGADVQRHACPSAPIRTRAASTRRSGCSPTSTRPPNSEKSPPDGRGWVCGFWEAAAGRLRITSPPSPPCASLI
jgi:homocysteine S-methyltransferase